MAVQSQTEQRGAFRQVLHVGSHTFHADTPLTPGEAASAPGPHDYFDAALASCKALTAMWYAKKSGMALERVETQVERDDSRERQGTYVLHVKLAFHGNLTPQDKQKLHDAVARCPIHKLMTSATIEVVTAPLEPGDAGTPG
ncbi:OsmC family protein [Stigmatella sp. ncwal1]|uniref:OsmC family protein n=1 Tax=Stigmatella ashevillensis TaxID=2995309 RepID=A0ABT5DC59_9BACT|nr:OsmC family protein [Stigmatella ashevillena]MDC0711111.1 OsmC family protein [Stigmatella ashevillena]